MDEQLNAWNETRIIWHEKQCSRCDLPWLAHSTHLDYGNEAVFQFLRSAIKYRRVYRTGTDDIDSDLSFELGSPSSGKRTDSCFAGAVDCGVQEILSLRQWNYLEWLTRRPS